jgi:hypothetical protein
MSKEAMQPAQRGDILQETVESVNETNAILAGRYFDLLKIVERYEKNGVTCQTFRHFVSEPCAECNCTSPQPPAQPEQEPVAWVNIHTLQWLHERKHIKKLPARTTTMLGADSDSDLMTPLYLAPQPQRQPLTDEEIESINVRLAGSRDLARLFARAIEAAHGIKE